MKMLRNFMFSVFAVGMGALFLWYIVSSGDNPLFVELIFGSVALGIVIGIVSSLASTLFHRQVEKHPGIAISFVFCCLAFVLALVLYSSNTPKVLSRQIPVTYLVNPNTGELPFSLYVQGQSASASYREDVVGIFKKFREKNLEEVKDLLRGSDPVSMKIFRDFTEYLTPYFIGTTPFTPEAEPTLYNRTTPEWFGTPHPDIRSDQPVTMDDISGPFRENLFYGITAFPDTKINLRLPKDTEITIKRDGDRISTIVFRNKFQEIRIGIQLLVTTSGGNAYLAGAFSQPVLSLPRFIADELKVMYKSYNTIIHFDAKFSRLRYGYSDMKYYEEWAEGLLSLLERRFGWGNPNLYEPLNPYQR